jgi:hypothetical protein
LRFCDNGGTSVENAIIIQDVLNYRQMVDLEYALIKHKFRRFIPIKQELVYGELVGKKGKWYDVITIRRLPFFRKQQVFFDITEGFELLEKTANKTRGS